MSKEFYKSNKFQIIIQGSDEVYDVYINDKKAGTTKDSFELNSGDSISVDFGGNWNVQEESYFPCHNETCEFEKERYGVCGCETGKTVIEQYYKAVEDSDFSEKKKEYFKALGKVLHLTQKAIAESLPAPKYPKGAIVVSENERRLEEIIDKHGNRKPFSENTELITFTNEEKKQFAEEVREAMRKSKENFKNDFKKGR